MGSQKKGAISLVFAQWVERAQSGHINPATPVTGVSAPVALRARPREGVENALFGWKGSTIALTTLI